MKVIAGAGGVLLAFVFALVLGVTAMAASPTSSGCGGGAGQVNAAAIAADASSAGYGSEQLVNAAKIMNAATELGLSTRAQQIGVMTAMGESGLRNIDYGDGAINPDGTVADSIGLFQQQSSWGSTADRMDPGKAATLFFQRLKNVDGWESMDPSLAAHTVQVNADPNHYTKWWQDAVTVTDYLAHTYPVAGVTACTTGTAALPLKQPYDMTDDFGPRDAPTEGASSWHPADDLVGHCGDPIYAVLPGKVTVSDRLYLSIESPDGFVISYLHSHKSDRSVNVGDQVHAGQQISLVGDESPATGCHLDIRINVTGNNNPQVATLPTFPEAPGWVDPEAFMKLYGVDLCPTDWCARRY